MRRTHVVTRVVAVFVIVMGLTIAVAAIPTSTPKDRAAAWVNSLSLAERATYARTAQVAGMPAEYRLALFATLKTAKERTAFWQGVFSTYRRDHTLSPAQEAVLGRAEALLPVAFAAPESERAAQEAAVFAVRNEVKQVLGLRAYRELFLAAGPDGRTDSLPFLERAALRFSAWSSNNLVGRAARGVVPGLSAVGCNCNSEQNDCYYESHCTANLNSCTHSGGCACDWIFFDCWTCDGLCNYDRIE